MISPLAIRVTMGEATDGSRGGCKIRGARVCRLAMALALTGSQAPIAAALPRPAAPLGALHNDRTLIAAAGDLTLSVKDIDAEPGSDPPLPSNSLRRLNCAQPVRSRARIC